MSEQVSKIGFCMHCHELVEPIIRHSKMTANVRGQIIEYDGLVGYCPNCECELGTDNKETLTYNSNALRKQYRIQNDLIHPEQIAEILKKYNIGKRPLSLLLGWGEVTLTRYLDGYPATKEYSDLLKQIFEDPEFYKKFLEQNAHLISSTAYRKSLAAVNKLIKSKISKIEEVALYVINKTEEITNLKLQKTIFFIQQWYLSFFRIPLFVEEAEAWRHGPVYPSLYHKYKKYGKAPLDKCQIEHFVHLSEEEIKFIDSVGGIFLDYSVDFLVRLSHEELPWKQAMEEKNNYLSNGQNVNVVISKESMLECASSIQAKYNIYDSSVILEYLTEKIHKYHNN